ncbi:hypothetical protein L226DRAFT_528732 [Lentinus tigrinus ALCF2SS1-7]|uniref:uncharacterized protein n=1 Tax=Lentinus tigrinus ALCF2SS1-7 TaxID=1328758 RepID=UPI001165CA4A|nr:hypothetical protein L226DRAFT_528732 [Lentinus tigrinus ALCF2SS1-7]
MRAAEDANYLSLHHLGLLVLADVEDEGLAPVLRGIFVGIDSIRMFIIRKICALPLAVDTLIHVARCLVSPGRTLPKWSVTWVHLPSPQILLPSQEDLEITLGTICVDIPRHDCNKVVKQGLDYVQECKRQTSIKADSLPVLHSEAVLIHHIIKNNVDVYPYLAASPISFPWSCYACARLLGVVNTRRNLQLTLRGCSDLALLPSALPSLGKDIDAALSEQMFADVQIFAQNHLDEFKRADERRKRFSSVLTEGCCDTIVGQP